MCKTRIRLSVGITILSLMIVLGVGVSANCENNFSRPVIAGFNSYIEDIHNLNDALIKQEKSNIKSTITFSDKLTKDELEVYLNKHNINALYVEGRIIQSDGTRTTFIASVIDGLDVVFATAIDDANQLGGEVAGFIAVYGYVNSPYISSITTDPHTYLLDTSLESPNKSTTSRFGLVKKGEIGFVKSLAWELEDFMKE